MGRSGKRTVAAPVLAFLATAVPCAWAPTVSAAAVPSSAGTYEGAQIVVEPQTAGTISKYLFGANLLWAYNEEGAYDPATDAFYPEFVASLRRLGITSLRYPGGTASDSFDWLRAVGPETERLANEPYGMQYTRISDICCDLDGPDASAVGPEEFGQLLDESGAVSKDDANRLIGVKPRNGVANIYGAAMWDQEGTEALIVRDAAPAGREHEGTIRPANTWRPTRERFLAYLSDIGGRIAQPARIEILSNAAAPQSAPPDTLTPSHRTYAEAVALMAKQARAPASTMPLMQPKPETIMIAAMTVPPIDGNTASSIAAATRSDLACCT